MRRAALALGVALVIVPSVNPRESKKKRDVAYEAAVQAYAQMLKPRMTRVEVETYLRKQGTQFMHMCCVERDSYWDDLVKIGEEGHPWYCSEHYVYVAFLFITTQPNEPWKAERWKPYDTDVLKEISLDDTTCSAVVFESVSARHAAEHAPLKRRSRKSGLPVPIRAAIQPRPSGPLVALAEQDLGIGQLIHGHQQTSGRFP
jgi:hypothetical protein